ncbi:hypothetical protein BP6252_06495 [Coleophoma cylindrospora]|uniref:Uncharacterized protein n=1 Tax=Coleophoma cylindrospora TaxID=1849047 RepID=A0A3D8RMT6_9HELO|nr:hypothetical protein BP6252_06495 [Coleophoma cylindrospora]
MSPQRYAPIPQREEPIVLESIHSSGYNYNSGIPNSVSCASAPSIPSSPPPSFHSSQSIPSSPGTPRPTDHGASSINGLWNAVQSGDSDGTAVSSGRDSSLELALLRNRMDRLEESLGRLLLEKGRQERTTGSDGGHSNCCVTFRDPHDEAYTNASSNCCVTFSSPHDPRHDHERRAKRAVVFVIIITALVSFTIITVKYFESRRYIAKVCGPNCQA